MDLVLVEDAASLADICRCLERQPWLALDTEFKREDTFYAQLCLIQLAAPNHLVCVDPLKVRDLTPLLALIYAPGVTKIIHAARQDLEIFYDLRAQVPTPVFDTQIAAALLGYNDQIGYSALVQAVTGVGLDKAQTRTDWSARPLSPAQLRYAADDVLYLRDLYRYLLEALTREGRLEWLQEECLRLTDATLYAGKPEWRLRPTPNMDNRGQGVLRDLLLWRERTAQARNLPRNWVVTDADLMTLAHRIPTESAQLDALKLKNPGRVQAWWREIQQVLADSRPPAVALWPPAVKLTREQQGLYTRMAAHIRERAEARRIAPLLVATRRDLEGLILGDPHCLLMQGWRRAFIGEELLALLRGQAWFKEVAVQPQEVGGT